MIRIDLDANATTPLLPEVLDAMAAALRDLPGNPSSLHAPGRRAREALERARASVAALIGATPEDLFFVSGGTEANNLALRGTMHGMPGALLVSSIEHASVLECAADLERQGTIVRRIDPAPDGVVPLTGVEAALEEGDVSLVSLMLANNETGCLQPVGEVARQAHPRGVLVHTDAVQGVGKMIVSVSDLGVDLLSLSAHKIGGPKGIGALWCRGAVRPRPLLQGGGQEGGLRPGTENVAAAVGFARAAELASARAETYARSLSPLRDALEAAIVSRLRGAMAIGSGADRVANTTCIAFEGIEGATLVQLLDLKGISASTGAACDAGSTAHSHVLRAMRVPERHLAGGVRFSLGFPSEGGVIEEASRGIVEAVRELGGR
ncbi:MAG: cysteine desulfurase [Candidatus Eisenbacteria bacterium]|nr:cysteine desulfurase [Candidatus Eisenbacteria bacterium]